MTKVESYLGRSMYPGLTLQGKQDAAREAKLARKRKTVDPMIARGAVSPLGGVAQPSPQPKQMKKK